MHRVAMGAGQWWRPALNPPPRNQVVPMVRPPSGAISARPCHGLSGAPYTCSGGPSELGGWVHGCWGQHHRRAHPSNAFCPPHATQVRGRTYGTTPPVYLGTEEKKKKLVLVLRCTACTGADHARCGGEEFATERGPVAWMRWRGGHRAKRWPAPWLTKKRVLARTKPLP